ncbi:Ecto-NOX disulfide-thiol exchanger 1 like protein [Argiope bruennichi]|uniref:Ecto-NOX disulfide-thiol exchanger 1 like protein n=1 Tax=Argiope bruennichi TaxID=94029 RepID=A0A8T0FRS8_ARGBR|nr:Ecto-NOX disulfide-thiol exchanger 1 like protein [Argiope bruennichi]
MEKQIVSIPKYSNVYNSAPRYSEQKTQVLGEKLVKKETFYDALQILIAWLERGECNVKNSECFNFLIQLCWYHVEKLQAELYKNLENAKKDENGFLRECRNIQLQLIDIEDIFKVIDEQNIWDFFNPNHLEDLKWIQASIVDVRKDGDSQHKVPVVNVAFQTNPEYNEKESNIEVVQPENNVHKMQPKRGGFTYELNTAYQEAEEMEMNCKECENKWQESNTDETARKEIESIDMNSKAV